MNSQHVKRWASVLLTVFVLVYLAAILDVATLADVVKQASPAYLLVSLVFFAVNTLLRACRFAIVSSESQGKFTAIVGITFIYSFLNYFLPIKAGEFSYPLLAKRYGVESGYSQGFSQLIYIRVWDLLVVFVCASIATLVYRQKLGISLQEVFLALVGAACIAVVILVLIRRRLRLPGQNEEPGNQRGKLFSTFSALAQGVRQHMNTSTLGKIGVLTVLIWVCVYSNFYFLMLALGVQATYFESILILLLMIPISFLPIQGLANTGGHELAWVTALMMMGLSYDRSVYIALASHAVLVCYVIIIAGVGLILIRGKRAHG